MTDRHDEHYESIPWDSLVTDDARRRRRWAYLGIGLVVALALGGAIGRALSPVGGPVTTTGAAAATATVAEVTTTVVRAVASEEEALTVRSHAEWFVADYFTVDGSDVTRQSVIDRLPAGAEVPEPTGDGRSFVESVFTTSVEPIGAEQFRVVLVVRSLAAPDGVSYLRQPARAVEVLVELTADGAAIVDLPRPAVLETAVAAELDASDDPAPEAVLEAARVEAELWGTPTGDPIVGRVGDVWRVVNVVEDDQGLTWPVASWLDESGARAAPSS